MRICLVHEEYPEETNFGGIATYQKRIAEEYARQGHEVYVIARGLEKDKHYKENGVDITRIYVEQTKDQVYNYEEYRRRVAKVLLSLQNKNKIDIIEVPDWGAETVMFEDFRKVPLVVRLHTPLKVWLKFNKNNFGAVLPKMLEWEDKMLKSANLVTCCSEILKSMIVKMFKMPENDIVVTPNPANLTNFYKNKEIKKEDRILYVGSLEERKGVCVFANALNTIFNKYPDVKVDFIGKDTTRNAKNISTIEYVKELVDEKYHSNLTFYGQLPNYSLNEYYNRSRVAVFPSLFDNFPYVTLEAMATGVHIVGSKNSGMVEMLNDNESIYNTPSSSSLANLVMKKYVLSFKTPYSTKNINRVNKMYRADVVCSNMLTMYEKAIVDYQNYCIDKPTIEYIFDKYLGALVKSYERLSGGVANAVYKVFTNKGIYVLKKYNYDIDFALGKKIGKIYADNNINSVMPINEKEIKYLGNVYNIFKFVKSNKKPTKKFVCGEVARIISVDRKVGGKSVLRKNVEGFYKGLKKYACKNIGADIDFVNSVYEDIKDCSVLGESYLNHGDLSFGNLLFDGKRLCVIDFDQATIAPQLYDYAVVSVKQCVNGSVFDFEKMTNIKNMLSENFTYEDKDFKVVLKFYLCKILLEKFYLYAKGKIDLFSKKQMQDDYRKYVKLLKSI